MSMGALPIPCFQVKLEFDVGIGGRRTRRSILARMRANETFNKKMKLGSGFSIVTLTNGLETLIKIKTYGLIMRLLAEKFPEILAVRITLFIYLDVECEHSKHNKTRLSNGNYQDFPRIKPRPQAGSLITTPSRVPDH